MAAPGDSSAPPWVATTQRALGELLEGPAPTPQQLLRPPFRLVHDVVSEIIARTGFGVGLYTDEEGQHASLRTAESKRLYLSKIVGLVGVSTGQAVPLKPIVDAVLRGRDAQPLNELLVSLAAAARAKAKTNDGGGSGSEPPTDRPAPARGRVASSGRPASGGTAKQLPSYRADAKPGAPPRAPEAARPAPPGDPVWPPA